MKRFSLKLTPDISEDTLTLSDQWLDSSDNAQLYIKRLVPCFAKLSNRSTLLFEGLKGDSIEMEIAAHCRSVSCVFSGNTQSQELNELDMFTSHLYLSPTINCSTLIIKE
jgi:hypothetical protein